MNEQQNNQNQTNYNRSMVAKVGSGDAQKTVAAVEGWAKSLFINNVQGRDGQTRKVAELTVNSQLSESTVKYLYGSVPSDYNGYVQFHVSFWGGDADFIEAHPPVTNQLVEVLLTPTRIRDREGNDGRVYHDFQATALTRLQKRSKAEGKEALSIRYAQGASPVAAPASLDTGFEELDDMDVGELPF